MHGCLSLGKETMLCPVPTAMRFITTSYALWAELATAWSFVAAVGAT